METLEEMQRIMDQGFADVTCPACGEGSRVEPDADYDCGGCGRRQGWASPLWLAGLI
jgi:ribosomal protein S27E